MKKENRIRLFDILIGLVLVVTAGRALISGLHDLNYVCRDLLEYGFFNLYQVELLVRSLLALACGITGAIGFAWRRTNKYYRNVGILFIALSLWIALLEIIDIVPFRSQAQAAGTGNLVEWMFSISPLNPILLGYCLARLIWGILLIIYGKKLLPAWQAQGALIASGPFPFVRELHPRLKEAWHEMRERNKMP